MDVCNNVIVGKYDNIDDWFNDIQRTLLYSIKDKSFYYKSTHSILPIAAE